MAKFLKISLVVLLVAAAVLFLAYSFAGDFKLLSNGKDVSTLEGTLYVSEQAPLVLELEKPSMRSYTYSLTTIEGNSFVFIYEGNEMKLPGGLNAAPGFDVVMDGNTITVTPKGDLANVLGTLTNGECLTSDNNIIEAGNLFRLSIFSGSSEAVATVDFTVLFAVTLPEEVVF